MAPRDKTAEGRSQVRRFVAQRAEQDELVLARASLVTKRFYNLDAEVYKDGALSSKIKEMMGLVASLVLRCDDCVKYHLGQCRAAGVTDEEMQEATAVALIVGGSIVIPHLRRAAVYWEELKGEEA